MLFKCKTCGMEFEISEGLSEVWCAYCGTKQTLLKPSDSEASNIFARADDSLFNSKKMALLERGFMELGEGHYKKARNFFDQALDYDAQFAMAYVGKLMADLRVKRQENLANYYKSFENNKNYQKAMRFAGEELTRTLQGYVASSAQRAKKLLPAKTLVIVISIVCSLINVFNVLCGVYLSYFQYKFEDELGSILAWDSRYGVSGEYLNLILDYKYEKIFSALIVVLAIICLITCFLSHKRTINKILKMVPQILFSISLIVPYMRCHYGVYNRFYSYYDYYGYYEYEKIAQETYQLNSIGWIAVITLCLAIILVIVQFFLIRKIKSEKKLLCN